MTANDQENELDLFIISHDVRVSTEMLEFSFLQYK